MKRKFLYLNLLGICMYIQNSSFATNKIKYYNPYVKEAYSGIMENNKKFHEPYDLINSNIKLLVYKLFMNIDNNDINNDNYSDSGYKKVDSIFDDLIQHTIKFFPEIVEDFRNNINNIVFDKLPFGEDSYKKIILQIQKNNSMAELRKSIKKSDLNISAARFSTARKQFISTAYKKDEKLYDVLNRSNELSCLIDYIDSRHPDNIEVYFEEIYNNFRRSSEDFLSEQ